MTFWTGALLGAALVQVPWLWWAYYRTHQPCPFRHPWAKWKYVPGTRGSGSFKRNVMWKQRTCQRCGLRTSEEADIPNKALKEVGDGKV